MRAAEPDTPPARGPGQAASAPCAAACGEGFDPFAWLARLFGGGEGKGRAAAAETKPGAGAVTPPDLSPATDAAVAPDARPASPAPANADSGPPDPPAALLPAEPGRAQDGAGGGELRTGEVVARIWIAPFVDADGVYREAAWVRAVLAPAGWRLP